MAEARASSSDETTRKLRTTWKIGEKFPINFVPSVEGMVASTKWREGVFSVVFVSPPYERQGGSWADAALTYRTATTLVKKPLPSYEFPFPTDTRIYQEVVKANGNVEMLQEVVNFMNKGRLRIPPIDATPLPSVPVWESDDKTPLEPQPIHHISEDTQIPASTMLSPQFMDKLVSAFSERLSLQQSANTPKELHEPTEVFHRAANNPTQVLENFDQVCAASSLSALPQAASVKQQKKKKKKHRSSSSSTSSSSSSGSSSSDSTVGPSSDKAGSGWFKCPFSAMDFRQTTLPRHIMRGKHEERKMLRWILHTLYSNFTSLRAFVDTLKVDTTMSQFKPYSNDLTWLGHHATYLDAMCLQSTDGPWKMWNELSIDFIARSFLELMVRVSPNRKYPDLIDEKVRKWMKRKRIGMSTHYGAIPNYLADAKVTEDGIQPKAGWTPFPKRENRPFQPQNFKPKTTPGQGASMEKKSPV